MVIKIVNCLYCVF